VGGSSFLRREVNLLIKWIVYDIHEKISIQSLGGLLAMAKVDPFSL
jgi:hypothetical protein